MGYPVQDNNENGRVKTFGGNTDGASGGPQTDFIISEPGYPNDPRRIVFDKVRQPRPAHRHARPPSVVAVVGQQTWNL